MIILFPMHCHFEHLPNNGIQEDGRDVWFFDRVKEIARTQAFWTSPALFNTIELFVLRTIILVCASSPRVTSDRFLWFWTQLAFELFFINKEELERPILGWSLIFEGMFCELFILSSISYKSWNKYGEVTGECKITDRELIVLIPYC